MAEEIDKEDIEKIEEEVETESKKKRGRPKKADKNLPTTDDEDKVKGKNQEKKDKSSSLEQEIALIKSKIAELETNQSAQEIPEVPKEIRTTLSDRNPYPDIVEQEIQQESLEEKVKDSVVPETKESTGFWGKIFKKNKIKSDGMVAVILLHPTGDASTHYIQTEKDGMFKINDEQYHVNEHCIYSLKLKKERYPLCILPTWTMIPIGTKAWFELSQERRGHELERMILNAIKKEEMLKAEEVKKKGMSAKMIWIILALLVGGYIFLKSRGG